MAGLFDKQAKIYVNARPNYPSEWFSMLAALTPHHTLAWDAGTGNGQAALGVAEHYEQVIATDVSEGQLQHAMPHPKVRYIHTPLSMSEDELVNLIGGENSVDLVTVATAVHWFDLPSFYSLATRLLRKPGGVIAVWTYNHIEISPTFNPLVKHFFESTSTYWNPKAHYAFDGYRTLPFPFESVGLDSEGNPAPPDVPKEMSFDGFVGFLRSSSGVTTAREQGVDLLSEGVIKEFESAWGESNLVRSVNYKVSMLVGKVKAINYVTRYTVVNSKL